MSVLGATTSARSMWRGGEIERLQIGLFEREKVVGGPYPLTRPEEKGGDRRIDDSRPQGGE